MLFRETVAGHVSDRNEYQENYCMERGLWGGGSQEDTSIRWICQKVMRKIVNDPKKSVIR